MARENKNNNQVMVITGASSGIGRATALAWAKKGGRVVLAARSRDVLEEVAALCEGRGGKALVVQADVSKEEEVNRLAEEAVERFGKIDIWLNNAAVMVFGDFDEIPSDDFRQILDTNLRGVVYGARAAVRQFREQGHGTLINMGSIAGVVGQPYSVPYSISKGGIRALGIALGQELENEKHINVCTVLPSIVDTPVYQHAANYSGESINPPTSATRAEEVVEAILKLTKKPQREVFVGKRNLPIRLGRAVAPKLFDKIYRKSLASIELQDPSIPTTKGNLYEPMPEVSSISGGWLEKEKRGERTTFKSLGKKAAIAAGILLSAGWLLSQTSTK